MDQILITGPREVAERTAFTAAARCRSSLANSTPTNAYYRLDTEDGCQVTDWTSLTPGSSISVALTADQNRVIRCERNVEGRILTVMTDRGLSGQFASAFRYQIRNLPWQS